MYMEQFDQVQQVPVNHPIEKSNPSEIHPKEKGTRSTIPLNPGKGKSQTLLKPNLSCWCERL